MREGRFFENKKESTNTFIEKGEYIEPAEFDKLIFDYKKERQRRDVLARIMGVTEYVKEPNERQEKIISVTLRAAEEVINQYSPRRVQLSKTNVFLMRREDAVVRFGADDEEGGRANIQGGVFVYTSSKVSDSMLAHHAAHELTHHASFHRIKILRPEPGKPYYGVGNRSGLTIGHPHHGFDSEDGGYELFTALNEAVTEQIAIEIMSLMKQKSRLLDQDFATLKRIYGIDSSRYSLGKEVENPDKDNQYFWSGSYEQEVDALRTTCEEIYGNNRERFSSPHEVFGVFAEAYFSGKLLKLARLIEKNYGEGTFRLLSNLKTYE